MQKALIDVTKCTRLARSHIFDNSKPVTIIASSIFDVDTISHRDLKTSRRIASDFGQTTTEHLGKLPAYIIHSNSPEYLTKIFTNVQTIDEKYSEFLIITSASQDWLANFTSQLYKRGIKQLAVLITNKSNVTTNNYPPYMITCTTLLKNQSIKLKYPTYPAKLPKILKYTKILDGSQTHDDFSIKINNETSSFEEDLLRLYADRHNMKVEEENLTNWNDALENLLENKIQFVFRMFPKTSRMQTKLVNWCKYDLIYAASVVPVTEWSSTRIFEPFSPKIWLLILTATILFIIFSMILNKLRRGGRKNNTIKVWTIISITINQGLPKLPTKIGLRFCIFMWFMFIFFINAMYNADYSGSMTSPEEEKLLSTFSDVIASNRPIGGPSSLISALLNDEDPDVVEFVARSTDMTVNETFKAILENNTIGVVNLLMLQLNNWNNRANESQRIYSIKEALVLNSPTFLIAKYYHPLDDALAQGVYTTIEYLRSSGIINAIYQKYYTSKTNVNYINHMIAQSETMIGLKHLDIAFKILFIGQFIGLIVLIIENRFKHD
ncbi:hypothetical protein HCN44_010678 [Aphidius gifuensis]|uniref:Ionotropic glutamate receptor C-terminal domain-containing protein n=1 Tax=Aphidius gifuensis TaxID=684658 RepID=A0A835CQ39_APHGI|nr:hypothetical protein HCN44_010678 [Aphidius gifuensis]